MDRALVLLLLWGGVRVSKVAQLQMRALDGSPPALLVEPGKGRQERRVDLAADAVASVHACRQQRPSEVPRDMVFWHQPRPSHPRSGKALHKKIQRSATAAGITASGHSLRHTVASNLLEQGAALVSMREWLGQAAMSSSARYAKRANQHVKQA
jgi:site-specific recombinase XerD